MRSETQVLEQLLSFARRHDSIRAVVINGSRINPNAPRDLFQDYDVVYYTVDPGEFLRDQSWIPFFGDLVILQQNDYENHGYAGHIFLMLFSDGVRIDLSFDPLETLSYLGEDSLTQVLLDKDGCIPSLPPPSDCGYYTLRPSRKEFDEAVNEIFWCSNNIAKGIWRGELAYAKAMFDEVVRPPFRHLLEWYAAMHHDWAVNTGKFGKWLDKYLPPEIWAQYVSAYCGADYPGIWDALLNTCRLADHIGPEVARHLGFDYPTNDARRTIAYLEHARSLPPDAVNFDHP